MTGVTPLLLTFNEAPNIARTLSRLSWAQDIVIVDSCSTDATREIAAQHPGVRIFQRPFTTHAEQWNFAVRETGITTEWVLALDADFVLSDELIHEIDAMTPDAGATGYQASFTYCIDGQPLTAAAYPPVVVLFRRAAARYVQDGHTQRVQLEGLIGRLAGRIFHDDRKPLSHWLSVQMRYMRLEADKLSQAPAGSLGLADQLRQAIVLAPPGMFFYCYILRGGMLDGRAGLFYALQRSASELILSLFLMERMLHRKT